MLQQGPSEAKAASWARSIGQPPAYTKPSDRRFDPTPGGYALDLRERVDEFSCVLGKLAGARE
jgi:hypothetical protein